MAGEKGKIPEYDSERETRVLLENMNKNIGLIAEQHGSIKQEIADMRQNMDQRFNMLEMAVMENGRKIDRVEKKLDTAIDNHEKRIIKVEEKIGI